MECVNAEELTCDQCGAYQTCRYTWPILKSLSLKEANRVKTVAIAGRIDPKQNDFFNTTCFFAGITAMASSYHIIKTTLFMAVS